ncbi:hypothetical protein PRK78_002050 [Emydomyces testavorans]|uniref:Wax synthase domain-containing protein n=1 Tax=Emydomyces testavorans TaxID=2070801 RepID=A0AAF0DE83_9EURO|nr:hypothetical protein PRK78_002050 [Emydomyces testavorans]
MANGYGVGLCFMWHTIWSAALLVFNDVQGEFKRIERIFEICKVSLNGANSTANGTGRQITKDARYRSRQSGETEAYLPSHSTKSESPPKDAVGEPTNNAQYSASYRWQPYPKTFSHRLTWVLDLSMSSFRGVGWNWGNPTLPAVVQGTTATKSTLKSALMTTAIYYMGLDVLKVLMMKDPYFWGLVDSPPPHFFAFFGQFAGFFSHIYRHLFTCLGILFALENLYGYMCIIYLSIALSLGPRTRITVPIEAPWLYPPLFGPCMVAVLDDGLAGAWGKWWHQTFRFGFVSPSDWIFTRLPRFLQKKSTSFVLRVIIAFTLSGLLHACGSHTQLAATYPLSGVFLFFVLQIPGVVLQQLVAYLCTRLPIRFPRWSKRLANLAFVVVWILLTGPFAADDFSRGGIWLFEPVPFSPLRALGFGAPDEGWLCWHGKWIRAWKGERWWQQGIQIL